MNTIFRVVVVVVFGMVNVTRDTLTLTPTAPRIPHFAGQSDTTNVSRIACSTGENAENAAAESGIINQDRRWTNFYVQPDIRFNNYELGVINNAMYYLMQVLPCVNFGIWPKNSNPSGDYVYIVKGSDGCSSLIGKQGGRQVMQLESPGCVYEGTVMHEMIHALGFYHEQCRPDRDDYVTIHFENILSGHEYNFERFSSSKVSTFGVAYDQNSIMHYSDTTWSKNGLPTITAKNGQRVGSLDVLRDSDKQKLKAMYNC